MYNQSVLPHYYSLPCRNNASASELQRRQDQLDSDDGGATARSLQLSSTGSHFADHSSSKATALPDFVSPRIVERESPGQASPGPMTQCVVLDATGALERVSEGVSVYSIPTVDQQEVSDIHECKRRSMGTPPTDHDPDLSSAAVQVTTPSKVPRARCEVLQLQLAHQENETTKISAVGSQPHNALRAQCAKMVQEECTYSSIESKLLPHGMCMRHSVVMV